VQGPREQMSLLKRSAEFLVLDATTDVPTTSRAPLALGILVGVVALAASGVLPIAVSAAVGATVMILSRCMDLRSALRAVSPSVLLVIVASLALARALIETGATDLMTDVYLATMRDMPPIVALAGLMLLLAILTNVVSNNAAAVIGTPIAIGVAEQLGLAPEPFVLAVLFGANMSFCTPMAYQTNLLIMAAGNYRFGDFLRVGVPLTLLTGSALVFALDAIYF
jgi:di/tricarboxylate transporter